MPTRWNSWYGMLNRLCEFEDAVALFLVTYKDCKIKLSAEEWDLIKELTLVFRPLYTATNELSGEKFTTISKIIPLTSRLMDLYSKPKEKESTLSKEIRKMIHDGLKTQFKDIESELLTIATIFDPRFKTQFFKKTKRQAAINLAKSDVMNEANDVDVEAIEEDEIEQPISSNVSFNLHFFPCPSAEC